MKTHKTTTIIAGILVALISLTAHATDKNSPKKTAAEKQVILESMGINKALENKLIMEYLKGLEVPEIFRPEKQIKIYNTNDELVYEGDPNTDKASALKIRSEFLMEYENVSYYMLHH